MSKISDELRERGNGYYEQRNGNCELFNAIADRIDAEMVELPRDADGVPIHVGDTVYTTDGSKAHAERICIMANTTHVKCAFSDGRIIEFQPTELTHTRPDSFERIADELDEWKRKAAEKIPGFGLEEDALHALADRIRKLAKERDDE